MTISLYVRNKKLYRCNIVVVIIKLRKMTFRWFTQECALQYIGISSCVAFPVCDRFGFWPLVCGRFGLWPFRFVAILVCGRSGLWPFRLSPFRFVAVMACYRRETLDQDINMASVHYTDWKPLVNSYIQQLDQTKWDVAVHDRDLCHQHWCHRRNQHLTRDEDVVITRLRIGHT